MASSQDDVSSVIREERRQNQVEKLINVYEGRLPEDIKDVFKMCRALVVGNEVVQPVITKMAKTPITNILVKNPEKEKSSESEERLRDLYNKFLRMRSHLQGISLDLYTYSNGFSSLYFAPRRYLICPRCEEQAKKEIGDGKGEVKGKRRRWLAENLNWTPEFNTRRTEKDQKLTTIHFKGKCPSCKKQVIFNREDVIYHSTNSLRLIRWDPYQMEIEHYEALGRNEYFYRFPKSEKRRIKGGDRTILCEYPWPYIEAALNNRLLKINKKGLYHFKMESVSGVYKGWGVPRIMSVLTALHSAMSMVKANEATSEGRVNDLTIISPAKRRGRQAGNDEDPIGMMGLDNWLGQVKKILKDFRRDKTLTAFLPFPVEAESIYGQGRTQLITGELQLYIRNIVAALGLPEDVIYSGGNYTSIAVAARILANEAEAQRKEYNQYLNFIKDTLSEQLREQDYSGLKVELEPYESPDDIQRVNTMVQMAMSNRFPWEPVYKRFGLSLDDVARMMKQEAKVFGEIEKKYAEAQGRATAAASAVQEYMRTLYARELLRAQNTMIGEEGQAVAQDPQVEQQRVAAAQKLAESLISEYPSDVWPSLMNTIRQRDPELAEMVRQLVYQHTGEEIDMEDIETSNGQPMPLLSDNGEQIQQMDKIREEQEMPDKKAPRSEMKL